MAFPPGRSIYVSTAYTLPPDQDPKTFDWRSGGQASFEAFDGWRAWHGVLPRAADHRTHWPHDGDQADLSRFDDLVQQLEPVPMDKIYPAFDAAALTRYEPPDNSESRPDGGAEDEVYLKAPRPGHYDGRTDAVAARFLAEAQICERIRRAGPPHPNLGEYLGCVVDDATGRVVRLALRRYAGGTLSEWCDADARAPLDARACMDQIAAAAAHLHGSALRLAHNDISPQNIMLDGRGHAVLIDFDCCAPLGARLAKGGAVTGWKGPVDGLGRRYRESSAECDREAIQAIREHLERLQGAGESVQSGAEGKEGVVAPQNKIDRVRVHEKIFIAS